MQRRFRYAAGTSLGNLGLKFYNVLSLISFRPFCNVEFYMIAFVQRFETSGLNCGMVYENIIPGIAPNKSLKAELKSSAEILRIRKSMRS